MSYNKSMQKHGSWAVEARHFQAWD